MYQAHLSRQFRRQFRFLDLLLMDQKYSGIQGKPSVQIFFPLSSQFNSL